MSIRPASMASSRGGVPYHKLLPALALTALVVGIPVCYFGFLTRGLYPNWTDVYAIVIGVVSLCMIALFIFARRVGESISPIIAAPVFACLALINAALLWNDQFLHYIQATGYVSGAFRNAMQTLHSPVYGSPEAAVLPWALVALGISGAFLAYLVWRLPTASSNRRFEIALLLFYLALILSFGVSAGYNRLTAAPHAQSFWQAVPQFDGLLAVLSDYNQSIREIGFRASHYPPGNMLLLKLEHVSGLVGLGQGVVIGLALATGILILALARRLGFDNRSRQYALLLFVTAPGPVIFPTTAMTPIVMFLATLSQLALLKALVGGRVVDAVLLGLSFALCALFSLSTAIVGLSLGWIVLFGLARGNFIFVRVVKTGLIAVATVVLFFLIMAVGFGFDMLDLTGFALSDVSQDWKSYDDLSRYLFRSTGNVIAYLFLAGFAIVGLVVLAGCDALRGGKVGDGLAGTYVLAAILSVFVAGFSGLFFMETERIWLFFTPMLALVAGYGLGSREHVNPSTPLFLVASALIVACGQELIFRHYL
ncbi:MAG: hypothetical protein O6909_03385 [Alphaproteobacteria bacterium]|nr:hypothetical protein [Alphaproteobacteria bacterium]